MRRFKITKERLGVALVLILSAALNFANIGINGYGNGYYAAGVKSMTMSLKNFFFVSFDPAGFVTIDKPPMGFWIQAIFAKIFGFSGWSILMPQAIAGVISVYLLYKLVKASFGTAAGFISALCLAVTPVFVAASRNNTIDNLLVATLLFACVALTKAAENGKSKYLYISLMLVGIGFNIKMLEAYMIGPALYTTYLLASNISFKKKMAQLVVGTIILFAVSLSWAVIVDLVPAKNRPYVGSSTNNSEIELIIGHNGLKRLGLDSTQGGDSNRVDGKNNDNSQSKGDNQRGQGNIQNGSSQSMTGNPINVNNQQNRNVQPQSKDGNGTMQPQSNGMLNGGPGGQGGVQGSFGAEVKAGITRLFAKSSLSDQIIWFLPLAFLGFIAGAIKENLRLKLDNKRKISLVLWITWLVPEFIYFSFTTGLFHPYYLTMMAPPAAALAGIGITTMWEFYKESKWKGWLLPIDFAITGLTHMMMLGYFTSNLSTTVRNIIVLSLIVCFGASVILAVLKLLNLINKKDNISLSDNKNIRFYKIIVVTATVSVLVTPFVGSSAAIVHSVNSSIPCAGLELLSNGSKNLGGTPFGKGNNEGSLKLINFLKNNQTTEKYSLVVSSSQSADNIIIQTGESVMALGGFSGSDKIITLEEFKELVKNGEVRYVLTGGRGPGGSNEIMNWVVENGKAVSESEYKDTAPSNNQTNGFRGGNNFGQLYDLKDVTGTLK